MKPIVPENIELIKGEIADYHMEEGILISLSKSTTRTVDVIKRNAELVKSITGGKPVPLLIYLVNSPVPDKETRDYVNKVLPEIYSAMAMISKPGLATFIMKFLFGLRKPSIPMKMFSDVDQAKRWLKSLM